ncbi:MAG: hypothetical protein PHR44_02455 [Candidatus Omnitrophica bacterium]|nr:hypothetical protein [Candidatus Omnitrophota bacterium]
MRRITYLLVLIMLMAGCATLEEANLMTPQPVTSEYFVTEGAGFLLTEGEAGYSYVLLLAARKPFEDGAFLEVYCENPKNRRDPLIVTKDLTPEDKKVTIESAKAQGFLPYHNYEAVVYIYKDSSKRELLGSHRQLVRAY